MSARKEVEMHYISEKKVKDKRKKPKWVFMKINRLL